MAASAFRIPALDQDFLLGDSTRGVRFQLEYQKAEEYLRAWGVESTVVVFGSARVREAMVPVGMKRPANLQNCAQSTEERNLTTERCATT